MLASTAVMPEDRHNHWPLDLRIFGVACALWAVVLLARMGLSPELNGRGNPFQDVLFGIKFYGFHAHITMGLQALILAEVGGGILRRRRWALVLGLIYMAQAIIGHVIFIASNLGTAGEISHVKAAAVEGPIVVIIGLYLWMRSRPLLTRTAA
jgi:hypothetical protein